MNYLDVFTGLKILASDVIDQYLNNSSLETNSKNINNTSVEKEPVSSIFTSPDRSPDPASSLNREDLMKKLKADKALMSSFGENIISGYLNLGSGDGWKEGCDNRVGAAFTRYILVRYFLEERENLGANERILSKVIHAFSEIGDINKPLPYTNRAGVYPKFSRACYDDTVTGWKGHAVTRLVGNLGSTYDPSKPAFEILVNSARTTMENFLCKPFYITIYKDEKEVEDHRKLLASLTHVPEETAYYSFYSSSHKTAGEYLKENQSRLGPNSKSILKGLEFLENTTISAQKVGNCWIKQPMRCLLTSIFIETLTAQTNLSPNEAWENSKSLYKSIQKIAAIPYVQDLVKTTPMTKPMTQSALQGIEKQINL